MFKILHVRSQIYKKILISKGNLEKRKPHPQPLSEWRGE